MPRDRRARIGAHQPSAKLSKRRFAVQEDAVKAVEIDGTVDCAKVSANDVLESLSIAPPAVGKKGRRQLKHKAFIDRVKSSSAPYSKAQKRRFNKKQRERLGGGLRSIEAVISALEEREISPPARTQSNVAATQQRPHKTESRTGMIGEGKGVPLSNAQRKRALETEKFRHPLILMNPQYAANPFETIRTHAQNTLEKCHDVSIT